MDVKEWKISQWLCLKKIQNGALFVIAAVLVAE